MSQTAFVEELLKRFKKQCSTQTSTIPANPIELVPSTEDDPGGKWLCQEAVWKPSVAFQHDATEHRE